MIAYMSMGGKLFTGIRTIFSATPLRKMILPLPQLPVVPQGGVRPHEFLSRSGWMFTAVLCRSRVVTVGGMRS